MATILQVILLLTVGGHLVCGQAPPFQVDTANKIQTCTDTKISLDTSGLTNVARGDDTFPCSGYLQYNDGFNTRRMCGTQDKFSTEAAERACYTLGVNHYRSTPTFSASSTRQIMLYNCFWYQEQYVDKVEEGDEGDVFDIDNIITDKQQAGCDHDTNDNPSKFDCFDSCYFPVNQPVSGEGDEDCDLNSPFIALGCTDINECVSGVRDNCKGPFESSCTIRKACGNNADCTNLPGSFECTCKYGYENKNGDPMDPYELDAGCKDMNECEESESRCDDNARCTNTLGSFSCNCIAGFSGDGLTCTASPCNPPPALPNAELELPVLNVAPVFADTLVYRCDKGFRVSVQNIPDSLLNYYGFGTQNSFTLTCDADGGWGPLPLPQCLPSHCVNPGAIPNAIQLSAGFLYEQVVSYECLQGYKTQNPALGTTSTFSRTCQEDGTWTQGTFCDDINECEEIDGACEDDHFCMNTGGGFVCIPFFPDTCELQDGLDLCRNGVCTMKDDKAVCVCDEGFTGILCETPTTTTSLGLIVAIVAIVLVVLLILVLLVNCLIAAARQTYFPSQPNNFGPTYGGPMMGKRFNGRPPLPLNRI